MLFSTAVIEFKYKVCFKMFLVFVKMNVGTSKIQEAKY